MKILLINPPYPFEEFPAPPFGLISLAAYLIKQGIETIIEDYVVETYSPERLRKVMTAFKPDIAGATAVTMNVKKAISILEYCREVSPSVITVMGGPHASFDADALLKTGAIDYVVRGEGEISFTGLIKNIEHGGTAESIEGISFRVNGRNIHNPDRKPIPDINTLPLPARHLVPLSRYRALGFPINMITSKGCPHKCIFCAGHRMSGNKLRYFDIARVVDEFEILAGMGFHQINIVDDLFTSNKKRCMAVCDEIIKRNIKHRWSAFARVDTVSEDLLVKLKKAGCETLCFGIESGNQEILDRVKKRTTLLKCRKAAELCLKTGITPMASYILGLPGETEETVSETLEFADNLGAGYGLHVLAPFPGTEVREKADEYGIKIFTDDWDLYDANRAVCDTGGISPEAITGIAENFYKNLQHYFDKLVRKQEEGIELKQEEYEILRGMESFNFNKKIITESLIEQFPGIEENYTEDNLISAFCDYVCSDGNIKPDSAINETKRLISLRCIQTIRDDKRIRFAWYK